MQRINAMRVGVSRVNAGAAQDGADLPDVGSDHKFGAHLAANIGWKDTSDASVLEGLPIALDAPANHAHRATGADRRGKVASPEGDSVLAGKPGRNRRKREAQIGKTARQIAFAKVFQRW